MIGSYLVETSDGPAVFDCGPASALRRAEARARASTASSSPTSGTCCSRTSTSTTPARPARSCASTRTSTVHVSEIGAPHLVDPSRLEASARRLYGDAFDELWGELVPVPEENVAHRRRRRVVGLECFPSPGHASHHVCFLARGRDALRRRCGRRPDRAEPARAPADTAARHRRRRVGRDARRARAARAGAARARPLRRLRRRRASPRASCATRLHEWEQIVETARRRTSSSSGARRARRARRRRSRGRRARDADVAVLRRAQALGGQDSSPAGHQPAPPREADAERREAHADQHEERRPDADDAPSRSGASRARRRPRRPSRPASTT